jgi:pimeloyl-ACP methyl ester carboxylesterase
MTGETISIAVSGESTPRVLIGDVYGPDNAAQTIVALPGLLETRSSFDGLVEHLAARMRIIRFDWPGRGDSSPLLNANDYRMSTYLRDLGLIYAFAQGRQGHAAAVTAAGSRPGGLGLFRDKPATVVAPGIHILGTSMGGLLALFLALLKPTGLRSVILNDVGCLLPWTGIVGLMSGIHGATKGAGLFPNVRELATQLNVDHRLIRAVQQPGHLDLPHETTLSGVDFSRTFSEVDLPLLILKGEKSEIVNQSVAKRLTDCNPQTQIVEIADAEHPVPYSAPTCQMIATFIGEH